MNATFPAFMAFGAMSILLLFGVFIRAKVKIIQSLMVPSSLFAGVLGFILVNAGWLKFPYEGRWVTLTSVDFVPFAFHAFTISFISLCLTRAEESDQKKSAFKGGVWLALVWTASLTVQALVGAATVFGYNLISGSNFNLHLGYLVTHGFTQGPGQGMAIGGIWASQGVPDAVTMGLIWASFGFLAAYVVGVPVARGLIKRGENTNKRSKINEEFSSGLLKKDTVLYAGRETTHSANIDTLAYHVALIGLVYVVTYFEMTLIGKFVKHPFFNINFFFFHGLLWAMAIRVLMNKLGIAYLTDPGIQKRITGLSIDFLLVGSVMAISFGIMSKYLGIIIAVTITVSATTFFMIRFFQRGLAELGPERALSSYGCCTGSAASGLLLLRILDADYSTPVAMELAVFNVMIGFTTIPIMLIMVPNLPQFAHWIIFGAYILNAIICFGATKFLGLGKKSEAYM